MLPEGSVLSLPNLDMTWLVRVLLYLILGGFIFFAIFMWRQVVLASKVLETKATPIVRIMAVLHLLLTIALTVIVVIISR